MQRAGSNAAEAAAAAAAADLGQHASHAASGLSSILQFGAFGSGIMVLRMPTLHALRDPEHLPRPGRPRGSRAAVPTTFKWALLLLVVAAGAQPQPGGRR